MINTATQTIGGNEFLISGLETIRESYGEDNGTPLQYSCLENPLDGGDWWAAVHGIAKSGTRVSYFTFTFHFHALEKEVATHSSVLAWRIPGTGEPGGLPSLGSHRVGHDWSHLAAVAAAESHMVGREEKNNIFSFHTKWISDLNVKKRTQNY